MTEETLYPKLPSLDEEKALYKAKRVELVKLMDDENQMDNKNQVDMVNHPPHYASHPSGIECIQITRHMGFNIGNAVKYLWRCDLKKDAIEDLEKAVFYIKDEIEKRKKEIK